MCFDLSDVDDKDAIIPNYPSKYSNKAFAPLLPLLHGPYAYRGNSSFGTIFETLLTGAGICTDDR